MQQQWELIVSNTVAEQELLQLSDDLQSKFLRITELQN